MEASNERMPGPASKKVKNTTYCSVPQCNTYAGDGVSFLHFPKDKARRELWQKILKMGKKISDCDRVCMEHFSPEDFFPRAKSTQKRVLKPNVVPSQKIPVRPLDRVDKSPQKRAKESRKRRAEARATAKLSSINRLADTDRDIDTDFDSESHPINPIDEVLSNTADKLQAEAVEALIPKRFKDNSTQTKKFSLDDLIIDASKLYTYTGLSSFECLEEITNCALKIVPETAKIILPMRQRILLTLTKLKLNISYAALSVLFDITQKTCSNYFRDTIQILSQVLKGVVYFPSKEEILENMPKCFRKFHQTRIVLDCSEVPVEKPMCLKERIMFYSHYKGRHTVKFCVGVSPAGLITFLSKCFGGRASDKRIVVHSKILDKLEFNDGVMVDKGFMIEKECLDRNLQLYRPPFLSKKKTLTKAEALRTAEIARARVHVERVIKQLKDFDILVDQISQSLLPYMNDIVLVCGAIANLRSPVLSMDKF